MATAAIIRQNSNFFSLMVLPPILAGPLTLASHPPRQLVPIPLEPADLKEQKKKAR